jgi:hypothetical protein
VNQDKASIAYQTAIEMATETMTDHEMFPGQDRHDDEAFLRERPECTARLRVFRDSASPMGYGVAVAFRRAAPRHGDGWLLDYAIIPEDIAAPRIDARLVNPLPPTEFGEERLALEMFAVSAEVWWDMQPEIWRQWQSIYQDKHVSSWTCPPLPSRCRSSTFADGVSLWPTAIRSVCAPFGVPRIPKTAGSGH